MTKEQLGVRSAWVKAVEKCGQSLPACAIQRRLMSPIENWKRMESNGWELPRPRTRDATGNRFGKRIAIRPLNPPQTFTTHGSPNDLDRIGVKIRWHLLWRSRTPT